MAQPPPASPQRPYGADGGDPTPPRFGGFTLRTDCNHCGQPIPLNGPSRRVPCTSCLHDVALPDALWKAVLEELDEAHHRLAEGEGGVLTREIAGFRVRCEYKRAAPACEKCGRPLPVERLEDGVTRDFCCVGCGDPASTYPAPDWLKLDVPTARQIYSTDPQGGPVAAAGAIAASAPDEAKPVVMSCPHCGGSLRITGETARLLCCQYCGTDIYLPDDLWRRLHPARTVRAWYVRFAGKTRGEQGREAAQRAQERQRWEQQVAAAQATERAEAETRDRDAEVARMTARAYQFVGVFYALLLLTIAWSGAPALLGLSPILPVAIDVAVIAVLTALCAVSLIVALAMSGRPIQRRAGYGADMMIFAVWFFMFFAVAMPVVGQIMALAVAVRRLTGHVGGGTIKSGGSNRHYAAQKFHRGETVPLGLIYLALALLWPVLLLIWQLPAPR